MVSSNGPMGEPTMASGRMASSTAQGFTQILKVLKSAETGQQVSYKAIWLIWTKIHLLKKTINIDEYNY